MAGYGWCSRAPDGRGPSTGPGRWMQPPPGGPCFSSFWECTHLQHMAAMSVFQDGVGGGQVRQASLWRPHTPHFAAPGPEVTSRVAGHGLATGSMPTVLCLCAVPRVHRTWLCGGLWPDMRHPTFAPPSSITRASLLCQLPEAKCSRCFRVAPTGSTFPSAGWRGGSQCIVNTLWPVPTLWGGLLWPVGSF